MNIKIKETLYLGGYEIYHQFVSGNIDFERETLHIMDDQTRISLAETMTIENGNTITNPQTRLRYQISDHLGSGSIELSETGSIISFEEYYPFGGTSYHSTSSQSQVSQKRYRYNGKEKDEETNLYYYGARYYISWLGRWMSADPMGEQGSGLNLYRYCSNNPVMRVDPDGMADRDSLMEPPKTKNEVEEKVDASKKVVAATALPGLMAASCIPGVGEAMDTYTLLDPDASAFEKTMSGFSLGASGASSGFLPNFGAFALASKLAGKAGDGIHAVTEVVEKVVRKIDVNDIIKGGFDKLKGTHSASAIQNNASGVLRKEMELAGMKGAKGDVAHHIVPVGDKSDAAINARKILDKYGVDPNSASNGAFLPGKTAEKIGESMKHSGRHPEGYSKEVLKRLQGATSREDAMKRLNDIRNDLVNGSWSKEAWGKTKK